MPEIYVGTSGWYYSDWEEIFYPKNLPVHKRLSYYSEHFNTVEVNATFYRRFKDSTYQNWYRVTPEGFLFVCKAPKIITHRKFLKETENDIKDFTLSASLLKEKLGLILLQLAPNMPYNIELLRKVIVLFKNTCNVAIEFRNSKWINNEVKECLSELNTPFCNADSPKSRFIDWVTSDILYFRFHGRKDWYFYNYSQEELDEAAIFIKNQISEKTKRVFIFFNNDVGGNAIQNALYIGSKIKS